MTRNIVKVRSGRSGSLKRENITVLDLLIELKFFEPEKCMTFLFAPFFLY